MTHARRGYALPLVFLLSLVVALALSLALERNTIKIKHVKRQLDGYREYHVAKGLQEAISAWLGKQNARTINDALADDGHALDLTLPDRSIISVYLRDGQGTILDPMAAGSGTYELALALRQRVQYLCNQERVPFEGFQRPLGPFAISINAADPLVIQAVAEEVVGVDHATEMVNKILDLREEKGTLERQDVLSIGSELGLEADVRNQLLNYFTVTPEMWYVTIEAHGGSGASGDRVRARYGGLAPIRSATSRNSGAWEQPGVFLTWEELSVE